MKSLLFLLVVCLSACTVTKKHFSNGYHVEWRGVAKKGSADTKAASHDLENFVDGNPELIQDSIQETSPNQVVIQEEINESIPSGKTNLVRSIDSEEQIYYPIFPQMNQPAIIENPSINAHVTENEETRVTEPLTIVALLILMVIGFVVLACFLSDLLLSVEFACALIGLVAAMAVFAVISKIRTRRDPNKYKNVALTNSVFSLSLVVFVVGILLAASIIALANLGTIW